jgi:hypothetical protein
MSIKTDEIEFIKYKCDNSFEFFVRYFFKKKFGKKFIMNEHHYIIIDTLEKIARGELKRVIFNIAPRYSKTELVVKNFIAWCLSLNDSAKFIHLSYSDQLALDNSEEIKDLISSDEYKHIYPNVEIKKDSRAKNKWYTSSMGGVLARSSSGQVTGFGAGRVDEENEMNEFLTDSDKFKNFGGAIIIDDPIKPDDANSDTIRDKINYKFETTIRNRVNSRNTPIIVVMQRLHEEDLCGYLMDLEPNEWTVISLPVIKEDGTALWEHKHTVDELLKIKSANPFVFETQYMQNPVTQEGILFPVDQLNLFEEIDEKQIEELVAFVDVATSKGGDYHCCLIGGVIKNKLYILDAVYTNEGSDINIPKTAQLINKYKPEFVRVESNGVGSLYSNQLQPLLVKSQCLPCHQSANKQARIYQNAMAIKKLCVFKSNTTLDSEYNLYFKHLIRYKVNVQDQKDDGIDCTDSLLNMAKSFYPEKFKE